jgi:hypothetical protein
MTKRVFVLYELPEPITPNPRPTQARLKRMTRQRTTNTRSLKPKMRLPHRDEWSSG